MEFNGSSQINVRSAQAGDVERMAVLAHQLGYPATLDEVRRRLEKIGDDDDHAVFVAEMSNGFVVGWVHVYVRHLLLTGLHAEVGGLVVDAGHRGCGIGRRLMQQVEGWAYEKGCGEVSLRSNITRQDAHLFYEKMGYSNAKTQLAFRKVLQVRTPADTWHDKDSNHAGSPG